MSTDIIAQLNDHLRQTGLGGEVVITRGVVALRELAAIYDRVKTYSMFTPADDPHGERDYGYFAFRNYQVIWKIDYFDVERRSVSPNPADPTVTIRVLTIMLENEY